MYISFKILVYHFTFLFSIKETILAQGKQSTGQSVQRQESLPSTVDVQSLSLGDTANSVLWTFSENFHIPTIHIFIKINMFKAFSPSFLIMVALISQACKLYFDLGISSVTWFDPFPLGGGSYSPFPSV